MIIRRTLALLLAVCMLATSLPLQTKAEETSDQYVEGVITRFEAWNEADDGKQYSFLLDRKDYNYAIFSNAIDRRCFFDTVAIWATNELLDKNMDTEAYIQYLRTIMAQMEVGFDKSVAAQAVHNLQTDYSELARKVGEEAVGITVEQFLGDELGEALKGAWSLLMDEKSMNDVLQTFIKDTNQLYVYMVAHASYEKKVTFLKMLRDHGQDKKLVDAANDLLKVMDLEFAYVLANYEKEFVVEAGLATIDLAGMPVLIYERMNKQFPGWLDEIAKGKLSRPMQKLMRIAKGLSLFGDALLAAELTGEAMELVVGDQVECYREMRIMNDVSEALCKAMLTQNNQAYSAGSTTERYEAICRFVVAGEALVYTHMRGEYCMMRVFELQDHENTAVIQRSYQNTVAQLRPCYKSLSQILTPAEEGYVVSEGFQRYDGLIKRVVRTDTVPEDYVGIYTFKDLMALRGTNGGNYILMADIACPDSYDFCKTGLSNATLEGNGYRIWNIQKPLFSSVTECTVRNLILEASYTDTIDPKQLKEQAYAFWTDSRCYYGMLCAYLDESEIDNCTTEGKVDLRQTSRESPFMYDKYWDTTLYCGGLAGRAEESDIANVYNAATITYSGTDGNADVAGLAGDMSGATIENSCNAGDIQATMGFYPSSVRVAGLTAGNSFGVIGQCYNEGTITATVSGNKDPDEVGNAASAQAAGLCVDAGGVYIKWCWNSGNITSSLDCVPAEPVLKEGIAIGKFLTDAFTSDAAGITCRASSTVTEAPALRTCRNSGTVSADVSAAGVVVYPENMYLKDCYNIGDIAGKYYAGGLAAVISDDPVMGTYYGAIFDSCYNTGAVSGRFKGGIAGELHKEVTCADCICLDEQPAVGGGDWEGVKKITRDQLKEKTTFEAFYDNYWLMGKTKEDGYYYIWTFQEDNEEEPLKLLY